MKNSKFLLFGTAVLFACNNPEQQTNSNTNRHITSNDTNIIRKSPEKMKEEDRSTFLTNAAIGGMMEVEASAKLLQHTEIDPAILKHAKMIRNDHIKANETLKRIAENYKFKLPTLLPQDKLAILKKMDELNDEAKGEFYLNLMLTEHNEAINLFNLAQNMDDKDISVFASKTLPVLRHHYQMTSDIKSKLLGSRSDVGDDVLKLSDKQKTNPAKNQH